MFAVYYAVSFVIFVIILRKYRESQWGKCKNDIKLRGKLAIVTGANSGIGFEIAQELAVRGADVILACRNINSARDAIERIKCKNAILSKLIPMEVDLGSIKSVQKFANHVKLQHTRINLLVNNAGISLPKHKILRTVDGFEAHFGINHLGHFLLTNLVLETMKNSDTARIIIISSLMHEKAQLRLDDLNAEQTETKRMNLYASSKLANMYFCRELAQRTAGTCVNVYGVCPGWTYTGIFRHHDIKWHHYLAIIPVAIFYMRTPKQGAQTAIYCATERDLLKENGFLYRDCQKYTSKHNFDNNKGQKLWELSVKMLAEKNVKL